jgi:hypothetical protein
MMAKRPAERPQSMQQIVKELRPLASQADLASVIDAYKLLQPTAEPLCSGHTVRLTELLQPSPAARRVGSLKYVLTLVGFILAAGLLSWLITRGPSDQDVASAVRPAAGGKTTVADATWVATPRRDSGLLYASAGLRAQQHAADSTVVAASLRTLVPRYPIREVAWNERGDRLAVLTDQGCLRIYRWDGERLRLETLYEDAATRRRIVDLAWHPHRDRLLLAAAQRICRADFSDPARPRFDSLAFRGDEIRRIDCLNQGDHNLLLIVSARGLDAIDLRSEQPVAVPALASSERLNVGTGGAVFAVHAGGKIDCWRARYEGSGQDAWTFQRLASHPIRAPHEVLRLAVDPEGQRLAVLRSGNATIFATQTLSRRTDIAMGNGVTNKSHLLFADAANSYRDEILVTSRTQIHLRSDQVGSVPGGKIESISSMALGGQLAGVCADLHPEGSLIAIACPGRLEVWNRQLQTVANLPPLKQLNQVLPSDLQTSAVICAADGSGVAISAEGALLGPNIPPLRPADMAYAAVNLHALLEHPTPELVQSTDWHKASPQRRPLKPFGLARAEAQRFTFASVPSAIANQLSGRTAGSRKRPTQTTFGAVFFPKALRDEAGKAIEVRPLLDADPAHVAIAARADVIAVVDALGRYICYRGSSEGGGRRTIGRLPGFSGDLSIALSRNGRRLFVTAGSRWRSTVGALDLMTRKPLWKVTFDQLPGRAYLNVLNNNTVLVTHRAGWRLLDPDSGATLRSRSTITEFGAVQARAELSRHDGSCYSWNEQAAIEPVAGWAPDLSLRWITLATATHGWLVIDPDGRIIAEKTASDPPPSRYIHAASHHEFAVEHDDYGRKDPTPPSAALTVLRHHNDGRVTLAPFLPAHVGRDR